MKTKLMTTSTLLKTTVRGDDAFLHIPDKVLVELGWKEGDDLVVDIPMLEPHTLVVYKKESPEVRLKMTFVTDKSREIR